MRRAYFKTLFFLFLLAVLLCVGSRSILYLHFMDFKTGLYDGGQPLVLFFNLSLAVFMAAWFLMTLLRRARHEYPVAFRGGAARVFSAMCGVMMLVCTALNAVEVLDRWKYGMVPPNPFATYLYQKPTTWVFVLLGIKLLTGVLGAAAMLLFAYLRDPARVSVLGMFPALWQLVVLLERFTGLLVPTQISENLLLVLFMAMSPLFLLGQARTVCGLGLSNSRAYLIPAGLSASLAGFCAVIPKLFFWVRSGGFTLPVLNWTVGFQIYMLLLSVYMAVYLYGYIKAIKIV